MVTCGKTLNYFIWSAELNSFHKEYKHLNNFVEPRKKFSSKRSTSHQFLSNNPDYLASLNDVTFLIKDNRDIGNLQKFLQQTLNLSNFDEKVLNWFDTVT